MGQPCEVCIVGAGITGLNALVVASGDLVRAGLYALDVEDLHRKAKSSSSLTPGSPPVRAIVSEFLAEDDLDPARLFAPDELITTMEELPLYADQADVSSCPLRRLASQPTG